MTPVDSGAMDARRRLRRTLASRGVAVAFAIVVGLYLVRLVRFQPVQLPAYLLILAYDVVEASAPAVAPYYPVGVPIFHYLVAVVAAALARRVRPAGADVSGRGAAGGVALVVGVISLLVAAMVGGPVVAPSDNPTPLAITGAAGLLLVAVAWLLLGRPGIGRVVPR